jgi:DNA-binding response OmpR family regulator
MNRTAQAVGPILMVEDDEPFAAIVSRHLRARGWDVRTARSAEEGVSLLAGGLRPALVLLDINLPEDSGWSLLRSEAYHTAAGPPCVVMTATSVSPSRLREFSVAGYLPKPFPIDTLIATIERLVNVEKGPSKP